MDGDALGPKLAAIAAREGWTFHPVVAPETITAFEEAHGTTLPEPYRRFLLEVCGGIDTDCMQLAPFARTVAELDSDPAAPFPYASSYGDALVGALVAGRSLASIAADPAFATTQIHGVPTGCIVVGELDGVLSVLVLTGEERGRVWQIGDFDLPETRHRHAGDGDQARLDFGAWFACWLLENGLDP